jgi:hypothetical protein
MNANARNTLMVGLRSVPLVWLAMYTIFAFLWVWPDNPIRDATYPILKATIGTYFDQNWDIFAPNPMSNNYSLLVLPLAASQTNGQGTPTPLEGQWIDVSTPLWTRFQHERFTAFANLARPFMRGIQDYFLERTSIQPLQQACSAGDHGACITYTKQLAQLPSIQLFIRLASAYCLGQHLPVKQFALEIQEAEAIPWSQRYTAHVPTLQTFYLGIFSIIPTVVPATFYGT